MVQIRPPGLKQGLAALALLVLPMQAMAATYYVATTGNDSNPGSSSQPWATIEKASNTVAAGDTVNIAAGTYAEYVTCTGAAGTSSSRITFQAASGATVIIDGTGETHALKCTKAYYTFDGLRFANANNSGLLYTGNLLGAIVKNCWAYNNGNNGINISSMDNAVVENCVIYDNDQEGLKIDGNADGAQVKHCTVWSNGQDGVFCSTSDTTITDCIISDNTDYAVDTYGSVAVSISYSALWNNGDGNYDTPGNITEGSGMVFTNPLLVDPPSDLRLSSNSPCAGTGTSSSDMGYPFGSYGPPFNTAPVVDAGADDELTLPNDTINLDGSVSDDGEPADPGEVTSTWTKQSGGGTVTFANANQVDTSATFSTDGTYVLRLTADDGDLTAYDEVTITVTPEPENQAPEVGVGVDKATWLPNDSIFLDATVSDDGLPNPPAGVTQTWTKQSGPGTVTFADDSAVDTTATFSTSGTYVLRLTADDDELTGYDELTVTVHASGGTTGYTAGSPAGWDLEEEDTLLQTIYGTAQDGSGNITGNRATALSIDKGHGIAFDVLPDTALETIALKMHNLSSGNGIRFRLYDVTFKNYLKTGTSPSRTDPGTGASAIYNVTLTTPNPVPHHFEPLVNSTTKYTTVVLDMGPLEILSGEYFLTIDNMGPTNTVGSLIVGDVNEAQLMNKYPNGSNLPDRVIPTTSTTVGNLRFYRLASTTATTYTGYFDCPAIQIITTIVNHPPDVNAGPNQLFILPQTVATLDGTVTDDGYPDPPASVTTTWTKVSGPGTVSFANASAVDTTATFSTYGDYTLRLTADDDEFVVSDDVVIRWYEETPPNDPPTVDAGPDLTVKIPQAATLDGFVSDDGQPDPPASVSHTWSKTSGPGTVTFGNTSAVDTTATFSVEGTYVLRLTADDSQDTDYDEVTVTVNPFGEYEGYGAAATGGGSSGTVVTVTNLGDGGGGSFRSAVDNLTGAPTIIKFNVQGQIFVGGEIRVTKPNVTIMGSSAPGVGVQLNAAFSDRAFGIKTANVIVDSMRLRNAGLENCVVWDGTNIVFDHCSFTWSGDGALDLNGGAYGAGVNHITISRSLFAGAVELSRSHGHEITWAYNLFTCNNRRQPKGALPGPNYDMINNYIRWWCNTATHMQGGDGGINIVNNYYGPPFATESWHVAVYFDGAGLDANEIYTDGNVHAPDDGSHPPRGSYDINNVGTAGDWLTTESPAVAVTMIDGEDVPDNVINDVGARPLDSHDYAFIFEYYGRGAELGGSPP